ncbi:hypothetical protein HK101_006206 [Irineochytrium annulatum]|nr:hypothetical protein HK101_006206 [Irineochytrium annulatum]
MTLQKIRAKYLLYLPPRFASNPLEGVNDNLSKMLMRFVPEIGGVVLAFSDVAPLEPAAKMAGDSPYFYFHITLVLTAFCPIVGSDIDGIVNKVSSDHIGLLVHGVFNASIPSDEIRANDFKWDDDEFAFRCIGNGGLVGPGSVLGWMRRLIKARGMLSLSGSLKRNPDGTGLVELDEDMSAPITT